MRRNTSNWAGNYSYRATRWHYPETIEQVQELVSKANTLKVLGSRHSFNDIADSLGDLICLDHFDKVLAFDHERHRVTIEGGVRYGYLCHQLHHYGYALHNLASLPHISVAGACATATHGSGDRNGNLATAVAALEVVTADGTVVVFSREQNPEDFLGAVVGLGGLGVVTKLTLDLVPTFEMHQYVYENLPLTQLDAHFEEIMSSAYSVSLFTDWQSEHINQVWVKHRVGDGVASEREPEWFGARAVPTHRHPIAQLSAEACTPQMGIVGPWYERLPHFRMAFTPSSGAELQSEYFVPRQFALAALHAIARLRAQVTPLLQISEVRTIAADTLWMSPCYQQPCVSFHFTWKPEWERVRQVLPLIEDALASWEARPHWAKLFTMAAERVPSLYPKLPDFQELLHTYDPGGKFRNPFLDRYIFGRG